MGFTFPFMRKAPGCFWCARRLNPGGTGLHAAAAARASTIMRRAATPAPAMSPATCCKQRVGESAWVSVSTARSVATTPAARGAVRRSNESVPSRPGRTPCSSAIWRTSRVPRQATSNPSNTGCGTAAAAANICTAAVRPSASERAAQRGERPGAQQRPNRLRIVDRLDRRPWCLAIRQPASQRRQHRASHGASPVGQLDAQAVDRAKPNRPRSSRHIAAPIRPKPRHRHGEGQPAESGAPGELGSDEIGGAERRQSHRQHPHPAEHEPDGADLSRRHGTSDQLSRFQPWRRQRLQFDARTRQLSRGLGHSTSSSRNASSASSPIWGTPARPPAGR